MGHLRQEVEPGSVGLDAAALGRLDRHFARLVDDGRLPGYLVAVSRHGQVAHLTTYGRRDRAAGLPVESDTLWRIYSMTKPVTSVAALILLEEGTSNSTTAWPTSFRPSPSRGCTSAGRDRARRRGRPNSPS